MSGTVILRGLSAIGGLLFGVIGIGWWIEPGRVGTKFFVAATNLQGLAILRADFGGFFIGVALLALFGAWRGRATLLRVAAMFVALALFGRLVSIAADGLQPGGLMPMAVEAVLVTIWTLAARALAAPVR